MQTKETLLADTLIGDHYVVRETHGPYIRVSSSQENHVEYGLKFWWMNTNPEEIKKVSKETADKGTILHGYIVGLLQGEKVSIDEEWAKKPCENFLQFMEDHQVGPALTEKKLVSNALGLGGTVDFIGSAKLNGEVKRVILDWKTGGVYLSYSIQLAIYMALWHEYTLPTIKPELIQDLAVVQVPRDGTEIVIHEINKPFAALRAGLCTFERWKFDNAKKLDWLLAPDDVLAARAKTKMEKRVEFEEANWNPVYQWPWLNKNSLEWFDEFVKKIVVTNKIKGVNA